MEDAIADDGVPGSAGPHDAEADSWQVPKWEQTPLAQEVFLLNNLLQRVADRMVAHRGLNATRWLLLAALEHFERPPTLTELSSDGLMTLQNVSRLVAEMERAGLVERFSVRGMGRSVFVRSTPAGEAACEASSAEAAVFGRWFLAGVSDAEVAVAERLLAHLVRNVMRLEQAMNESGVEAVLNDAASPSTSFPAEGAGHETRDRRPSPPGSEV